ncbi:hypothetical protein ACFXPS_44530 [Nocardia sp. NPDC059091]|uniref:hypothetical protein n=1 Tax=unclassified Nocardia TaxID=2637762 RepID=UPI00368B6456
MTLAASHSNVTATQVLSMLLGSYSSSLTVTVAVYSDIPCSLSHARATMETASDQAIMPIASRCTAPERPLLPLTALIEPVSAPALEDQRAEII